jgi:hypothetical protein
MSAPPVKLLSAPLPWPLRLYPPGSLSGCFAPRLIRLASNRMDAIPNQSIQATPVPDRRPFKPAARVATAKA